MLVPCRSSEEEVRQKLDGAVEELLAEVAMLRKENEARREGLDLLDKARTSSTKQPEAARGRLSFLKA